MQLFRLYAYTVVPQRTAGGDFIEPAGGEVRFNAELRQALDTALQQARKSRLTRVALRLNEARTSPIRSAVIDVGFSRRSTEAEVAARALARRLARAMDQRSHECLFLAAGYRESASNPKRRVALWIFPRDPAFRFESARRRIELLNEAFSRSSTLRKLALFEGRDLRPEFLTGDVLDFQARGTGEVADLWTVRFLDGQPSLTSDNGTTMIADGLRKVAETALDADQREQLHTAAMALRTTPTSRWSLQAVADELLSGDVRDRLLKTAPNDEARTSIFELNRELYEQRLNFRVFRLDNGVYVSAPLPEVGRGVRVERTDAAPDEGNARGERLRVEGTVVDDRLSRRRA